MGTSLAIYVVLLASYTVFAQISPNCDYKIDQKCNCFTTHDTFEYSCPAEEDEQVNLQVEVKTKRLIIQCTDLSDYDMLPEKNLSGVTTVFIKFCPLPNTSFHSILYEKFNISGLETLLFQSYSPSPIHLTKNHLSGLDQLLQLRITGNNLTLEENFLENNPKLIYVDLSNNHLNHSKNWFKFSSKLKSIDLAVNNLKELPSDIFQNLKELRQLDLRKNLLTSINDDIFKDTTNLTSLELSANKIESISENAFANLANLTQISLLSNKLTVLKENIFRNNLLLKNIRLGFNKHLNVEDYLLANKTLLENVSFGSSGLKQLPKHIFEGSLNIKNIDLQFNDLETLPASVFSNLKALKTLKLNNNKITQLPNDVFSSLVNLEDLLLNNNLLYELNDKLFSNLENLKNINLQHNIIHTIHGNVFSGLSKLTTIDLAYNNWEYSDSDNYTVTLLYMPFNNCNNVKKINLTHNHVQNMIEPFIQSKPKLESLDLSYNDFTEISVIGLNKVSKTLAIDLSNNQIKTVSFLGADAMVHDLAINLDANSYTDGSTVVKLSNNPFQCDCQLLDLVLYYKDLLDPRIKTLFNLKVDDTKCSESEFLLTDLRPEMLTCPLTEIVENALCPTECNSCDYRPYDKAVVVDCSENALRNYPQIRLPEELNFNQTEVNLSGNLLETGPLSDLLGYDNVTILNLQRNFINNLTWIPPKMKVLKLNYNNISHLSHDTIDLLNGTTTLESLMLDHNPWICDCSIGKFVSYITDHYPKVNTKDVECYDLNKPLLKLKERDYCKSYMTLYLVGGIITAFFLLSIAITLALYYRYEQEIKAWMYAKNMFLWFVTEEELDKDKTYDVFMSFSHKDEDFVTENLLPVLESGPQPFKVCIHVRDWIPGEFITNQIINSVQESRRTLVVLSKNFLESVWGKMEFRTAHTQALTEGRARVIVVLYGDVDMDSLDDELKAYLKTNTYVKWGDPWFWNKLNYALPHSKGKVLSNSQKVANVMLTIDEKFGLVHSPTTPAGTTPPVNLLDPTLLKSHPLNFAPSKNIETPPAEAGSYPLIDK